MKAISEIDFAKILLRNTTLTEAEYCEYIDRLKNNIQIPKVNFFIYYYCFILTGIVRGISSVWKRFLTMGQKQYFCVLNPIGCSEIAF